jgi:tRNA pseudouridine55 synthase
MVNGAILINKPQNISSAGVLRKLKHRFKSLNCDFKIGHAGTLDPLATGVLVVLLNKATKLQSLFLNSSKEYSGVIALGEQRATDDLEGEIIFLCEEAKAKINVLDKKELIEKIKSSFSSYSQLPPKYSAVKINGRPAYKHAAAGKEVEILPRDVKIEFKNLDFINDLEISYKIKCSKGTYVRSLARDIGDFLGVGGYAKTIQRDASGSFVIEESFNLEQALSLPLEEIVVPIEKLVGDLENVIFLTEELLLLKKGDQRFLDGRKFCSELVAIVSSSNKFEGMLEETKERGSWKIAFMV